MDIFCLKLFSIPPFLQIHLVDDIFSTSFPKIVEVDVLKILMEVCWTGGGAFIIRNLGEMFTCMTYLTYIQNPESRIKTHAIERECGKAENVSRTCELRRISPTCSIKIKVT